MSLNIQTYRGDLVNAILRAKIKLPQHEHIEIVKTWKKCSNKWYYPFVTLKLDISKYYGYF